MKQKATVLWVIIIGLSVIAFFYGMSRDIEKKEEMRRLQIENLELGNELKRIKLKTYSNE